MVNDHPDRDDALAVARKGDAARAGRLKAALRENLKRRKQQARGRIAGEPHDSAEIVPDKSGQ